MPLTASSNFYLNYLKLKSTLAKNKINLFYTILIFINHFAYGITANMVGATLVDLGHIFSVSLNVVSNLPVACGIGYLIGSLASYLYKYLNRQLMLIFFVSLMAFGIAFLPHYGEFYLAFTALVFMGIGSGAWDSATSIWLVDMWPVGNSPVLHGSQFMFGLGSVGAPILVSPFVYGDANRTKDNETLTVEDRIRALSYPFGVAGAIQMIVPVFLLILFFANRYEKRNPHVQFKNEQDIDDEIERISNPGDVQQQDEVPSRTRDIPHRKLKLLLCGLCLATYGTVEIGHFSFSVALFQNLDIHLTAATSAHIMSILSTTYTLGRLASAFISIKLESDCIISYHFAIIFGAISILFYGRNDLWYITVGTALLGYGFSAMWPAIFAFTERHLRLSDKVCSLFSFLSGIVSLAIPLILGQSFKTYPLILFILEGIFISVSLVLFVTVKLWISLGGARADRNNHSHVY